MTHKGFMIAAPASGSGKTTITIAVLAALKKRGYNVAPFKVGPDFIDTGYHRIATGNSSINLDSWMCPETFVWGTFQKHSEGRDCSVVEGAMGLFDGMGSSTEEGSSASVAKALGIPVVLAVNARGMAASAAPLVKGFCTFDPQVRIVGVIFNNVGSESHSSLLKDVMDRHLPEVSFLGALPFDDSVTLPSRHLGLVTSDDNPLSVEFVDRLAGIAEKCLDIDTMLSLRLANRFQGQEAAAAVISARGYDPVRIAVARDQAFCFIYEDNIRLLEEAGAEVVFFSPMADASLPEKIFGLYLPGGYPEIHALALSDNQPMKAAIRAAVESAMPVYAECGGLVYLTRGMHGDENRCLSDFAGIFPVRARMLQKRKALGYREIRLSGGSIIGHNGAVMRGHEFHYSEIDPMPDELRRAYRVYRKGELLGSEGFCIHSCLASYAHLHFGSNPGIAAAFVESCRRFGNR